MASYYTSVGGSEPAVGGSDGGGGPAVGGSGPAVGGSRIPPWQPGWVMDDLACLRQKPGWQALIDWLRANISIKSVRMLLSNHTSTASMPKKAIGPSGGSLKTAGMDQIIQSAVGDSWFVEVNLPHAFILGDGLCGHSDFSDSSSGDK